MDQPLLVGSPEMEDDTGRIPHGRYPPYRPDISTAFVCRLLRSELFSWNWKHWGEPHERREDRMRSEMSHIWNRWWANNQTPSQEVAAPQQGPVGGGASAAGAVQGFGSPGTGAVQGSGSGSGVGASAAGAVQGLSAPGYDSQKFPRKEPPQLPPASMRLNEVPPPPPNGPPPGHRGVSF